MHFNFDHSFFRTLPDCCAESHPEPVSDPNLIYFNQPLATELGIESAASLTNPTQTEAADIFSGNTVPERAKPIAQAYAGHQFGQFNPQLGDGRAIILGELKDQDGVSQDVCLKGSGRTPFSRGGDGKAALGPMLREVLIAEAMYALGIPTTRSLAVATTGEYVYRDSPARGAILTRTAASHIRIGTYEYFANRQQFETVKQLADYSIDRHFPSILAKKSEERYMTLLREVCNRQATTIAKWMSVGFIHGVMNTDNMLISGETIDYGPCAFLDAYEPDAVFSSIDHGGRYAYKNQPAIAQWNLTRLAECLIPIMSDGSKESTDRCVEQAKEILTAFQERYESEYLSLFSAKLGLSEHVDSNERAQIADDWLTLLSEQRIDFTNAFRLLADGLMGTPQPLLALFDNQQAITAWLEQWRGILAQSGQAHSAIAQRMQANNPWIIPRNHLVEDALQAASNPEKAIDLSPFERLLEALQAPFEQPNFDEQPEKAALMLPASAAFNRGFKTFCGT